MSCTELSTSGECYRCTIYSDQFDQLQSFFVDWSAELIRQLKAERELIEPIRSNRLRHSLLDGWDSSRDSSSNKTANQPPGSNDCGYGGDVGSANQEVSVGSASSAQSPNDQQNYSSTGITPVLSQVWGSVARKVIVPAAGDASLPCDSHSELKGTDISNSVPDDDNLRPQASVFTKVRGGKALYESVDQSDGGTGNDDEAGKGDKPECIFDILRETEAGRRTTAWTKRKDKVSSVIGRLRMNSVTSVDSINAHLDDTMDTLDSDVLNEARAAGTEVGEDEVLEFFDHPTPFGSYLSSGTGYNDDGQPADDGEEMEGGDDGNNGITDAVPSSHESLGHGTGGVGEADGGSLVHCSFERDQQRSSVVTCTPLLPLNTPDPQDLERPDFSPRPRYSLYWYGGKETQSPTGLETGFVRPFGSSSLPASVETFGNIFSPKMSFTTYSTPSSTAWQNVTSSGEQNDPSSSFLDNEPFTLSSYNVNKLALNLSGGYLRTSEPAESLPFCSGSDVRTSTGSSNANKPVAEVSGNLKLDTGHQLSYFGLKIMPPTESSLASGAPSATSAFSMVEKHGQGVDRGGGGRSMPETPPFRTSHSPATSGVLKERAVEVITKIHSDQRPPPHSIVNQSHIGFSASSAACQPTERLATSSAADDDYSKIKVKSEFYPHPPILSGTSSSSRAESSFMVEPHFAGPSAGSGGSYSRNMQPSNSSCEHGIQSHSSEGSASGYYSDMGGAENVYDVRSILGDRIWGDPSKLAKYDAGETWDLSDWHRVKRLLCYWMLHHCKRKHYINRQTELVPFCRAVVESFPRQKLLLEDLVNERRTGHIQRCLQKLKQLESEIERQNYVNRGDGSVKRAKKSAVKPVEIDPAKKQSTSSTKSLLSAEKDKKLRKLSKKLAKKYSNFTASGGVKNVDVKEESVVMNNLSKDWEPVSPPNNCADQTQSVNVVGTFSNTESPSKRSKNDDIFIIPQCQPNIANNIGDQKLGVDWLAEPRNEGVAHSSSTSTDLQLHRNEDVASVEQKLRRMRRLIPDSRNFDEIVRLHLETMEYRREYVKDPENTKSILDTFERFKDLPQLISLDFEYEMKLAGQSILDDFVAEWEDVWVPGIIQFAIRRDLKVMRSADHPAFQSLRWAQTVHDIDTDKRSEAALTILPFIIPGPIKYKNPNDHLKYFFAHFKDVSREAIWSELISLYSGDPQMAASPVIVRLGGQAGGTPNRLYYLFFNGQLVNTGGNASRALQLLVQSYFVFNVNYPIQVRPFYRFLEMVMGIKNNLGSTPSLDVFMTELKSHSTLNL